MNKPTEPTIIRCPHRRVVARRLVQACTVMTGLFAVSSAFGTPTGLNNIPTADVTDDRTLVMQYFSDFGSGRKPAHVGAFKMGLRPFEQDFEWGMVGKIAPGESGPLTFHGKYALPLGESLPTIAVGVANLAVTSDDRRRTGQPFTYGVVSHDLSLFRLHAGYGVQKDNNTFLLGVDRAFDIGDQTLILRSDFIQIDDRDQWLGSAGALLTLTENIAIEGWVSQPFDHGRTEFTIKFSFAITF